MLGVRNPTQDGWFASRASALILAQVS